MGDSLGGITCACRMLLGAREDISFAFGGTTVTLQKPILASLDPKAEMKGPMMVVRQRAGFDENDKTKPSKAKKRKAGFIDL